VRQHGNLSFTRVYEAGHEVPAYQPETAYRIFTRALFNRDISTGNISTAANLDYATEGPSDVFKITNEPIVDEGTQCYVLDPGQCTAEQWESVMNGTALVRNWIVVDGNTSYLFPDLGNGTSGNGTTPSGTGSPMPAFTGAASRAGVVGSAVIAAVVGSLVMIS
jgi:hypothetical protein